MNGGQIKQGFDLSLISPGVGWQVATVATSTGAQSDILWRDDAGHTALGKWMAGRSSRFRPHRHHPGAGLAVINDHMRV